MTSSSSEVQTIFGSRFDSNSDVKYAKVKIDSRGGKSVGILNTASNGATYLQTPLMLTWGVNEYVDDKTGRFSYDMALQFPSEGYEKPDITSFLENMINFENMIKSDAQKNAKEWFGKSKMTADAIDALWTPMLKYPKDQNTGEPDTSRSPTLKVKIPYINDEWKVEIYDLNQEPVFPSSESSLSPKDLISKGSHISVLILCGGIWFANGKFGVTWKMVQSVLKPKATVKGKCHISISNEDSEFLKKEASSMATDEIEDSEDDEDEDHADEDTIKKEVASTVEPKKKVVKKVVKKKSAD
tara:strand:- start:4531 stop:5427 length:897 start_codon:yes stop_codon:yes gene_type:complete